MADNLNSGHRERLRSQFLNSGLDSFSDHQVLELILTYAIKQRDVKPQAKMLLNRFGSLENVLKADIRDLSSVDGIGETSAVLLGLFYETNKRICSQRNSAINKLNNADASMEYAKNILKLMNKGTILAITLKNNMDIINVHTISNGSASQSEVDMREFVSVVCRDNPANVILAHNHPEGPSLPSAADIDFTVSVRSLLKILRINLTDHIIIGEDGAYSMRNDNNFKQFFN